MKKLFFVLAAGMLTFAACSEFDDSELKGRIDGLEDRVDDVETQLMALQKSINNLNSEFGALQALLNGGLVTDVKDTDEGLEIVITYADGTVKTFTVKHGTDGENGENGVDGTDGLDGKDGVAPEITVELDKETGRYVWVIDGEVVMQNGKPVYATGDEGAQGDKGLTPTFLIDGMKDGKPAFEETEGLDDELNHWFVSYNEKVLETAKERLEAEWTEVGVFQGDVQVTSGELTITYEDGVLKFVQGLKEWEFTLASNTLEISYKVSKVLYDEEYATVDVDEFATVRFGETQTQVITVEVEGAADAEHLVVAASLLNASDDFTVVVKDNKITVTANAVGATGKLLVDVLDGKQCYHSYLDLNTNVPTATISGLYDHTYGISYDAEGTFDFDVTISLNIEAVENIDFVLTHQGEAKEDAPLLPEGSYEVPEKVTVKKGETEVKVPVKITRKSLTKGNTYKEDYYSVESEGAYLPYGFVQMSVSDTPSKAKIVSAYTKWTQGTGEDTDGSIANTYDGNLTTFWESYYMTSSQIDTDPTYGVYIDFTIEKPAKEVYFSHLARNSGVRPTNITYGSVVGTTATELGSYVESGSYEQQFYDSDLYIVEDNASVLRFGVTKCAQGDLTNGLVPGSYDNGTSIGVPCVGLMEVEIYVLY